MNFKIIFCVVITHCILFALPVSSPNFHEKAKSFFNKQEQSQPSIYIVKDRPYSSVDAERKLGALSKYGFNWKLLKKENGKVAFSNKEEKKFSCLR